MDKFVIKMINKTVTTSIIFFKPRSTGKKEGKQEGNKKKPTNNNSNVYLGAIFSRSSMLVTFGVFGVNKGALI